MKTKGDEHLRTANARARRRGGFAQTAAAAAILFAAILFAVLANEPLAADVVRCQTPANSVLVDGDRCECRSPDAVLNLAGDRCVSQCEANQQNTNGQCMQCPGGFTSVAGGLCDSDSDDSECEVPAGSDLNNDRCECGTSAVLNLARDMCVSQCDANQQNTGGRCEECPGDLMSEAGGVCGCPDGEWSDQTSDPSCVVLPEVKMTALPNAPLVARPAARCYVRAWTGPCADGVGELGDSQNPGAEKTCPATIESATTVGVVFDCGPDSE